ncbi:uncharacterized protein HD556DRAFT_1482047 [Suillus plorans]|uniref:Uncharacterized protein n=1 Tax=Suillus plorans TaxID=116603 RepID=A0A9P7ANG5_9AGAM|nr:uncharacterized protein HD556DRAFT_1482047 [Suillus plorans]KAG1792343.1 hypothetical protein HD556DRAFT_1482047 [Suillus plorans]
MACQKPRLGCVKHSDVVGQGSGPQAHMAQPYRSPAQPSPMSPYPGLRPGLSFSKNDRGYTFTVMPPSLDADREALVRPKRVPAPSKRLTDASNSATPELSAHLEAIALKRAEDAKRLAEDITTAPATSSSHFVTPTKRSQNTDSSGSGYDTDCSAAQKPPKKKKSHSSQSVIISSDSEDSRAAPATAKKNQAPDPVNDDGFLADINIASLSNDEIKQKPDRKGQDVDNFFSPKYSEPGVDGKPRTYRNCTLCSKKGPRKRFLAYNKWAQDQLAVTVPSDDSTPTPSLVTPTNPNSDAASLSVKKELLVPAPTKKTRQPSVKPMRIGTKVTPRNLCALDWQANGHQREPASAFALYWNSLSTSIKEEYKRKATAQISSSSTLQGNDGGNEHDD